MASAVKGPEIKPSTVKKVIFLPLNRSKMQTVKKFQGISNLSNTAYLHGLLRLEEPSNWKNQFLCFQKHTL